MKRMENISNENKHKPNSRGPNLPKEFTSILREPLRQDIYIECSAVRYVNKERENELKDKGKDESSRKSIHQEEGDSSYSCCEETSKNESACK